MRALLHLGDENGHPCAVPRNELAVEVDEGSLVRLVLYRNFDHFGLRDLALFRLPNALFGNLGSTKSVRSQLRSHCLGT